MKKLLVDSSILIDFLRVKEKEKSPLFKIVQDHNRVYTSIIVHTELHAGKSIWEDKKKYLEVEDIFSGITILPITEEVSKRAGQIKAELLPDIVDSIIAATALSNELTLVTLNIKDFKKVKGLKLLESE